MPTWLELVAKMKPGWAAHGLAGCARGLELVGPPNPGELAGDAVGDGRERGHDGGGASSFANVDSRVSVKASVGRPRLVNDAPARVALGTMCSSRVAPRPPTHVHLLRTQGQDRARSG